MATDATDRKPLPPLPELRPPLPRRLDWYKATPIAVSLGALGFAIWAASSANRSAANSGQSARVAEQALGIAARSAAASEASAANSGRSAVAAEKNVSISEQSLEFQALQSQVRLSANIDFLVGDYSKIRVVLYNHGPATTILQWGLCSAKKIPRSGNIRNTFNSCPVDAQDAPQYLEPGKMLTFILDEKCVAGLSDREKLGLAEFSVLLADGTFKCFPDRAVTLYLGYHTRDIPKDSSTTP